MMNNMINVLKKYISLTMSIIFAATFLCVNDNNAYAATEEYMDLYEQMLEEVNEYRTASGLNELQLNPILCDMAEVRAHEITECFAHTRPDGRPSSTIFEEFDVPKGYSGENVAYHYKKSVTAVMDAWLDSQAHCANMFSADYEYLGVGLYEYNGYYYWAQVFSSDVQDIDLSDLDLDLYSNNKEEENNITIGDVDMDGAINASDASTVLLLYSEMSSGNESSFTENQIKAADVNQDGSIDASDASSILSYYSMLSIGLNPEF